MKRLALLPLTLLALAVASAQAGVETHADKTVTVVETPFDKGKMELQLSLGYFGLLNADEPARPQLDDIDGSLRLGWMLSTPAGDGCFRGNTEFLIEAYGAGIIEGPGSYLAGATLGLRYNFVQPGATIVPYFQLQAGGVYSDAAGTDQTQRILGSDFSFHLGGAVGVRFFTSERSSISLEANFRHLSNASTSARNYGANSLGGFLGFSWFF